ncbi:hypothetical protein [Candidatus Methylacidithermus pantelleriae]|uniref:hypothetical protein n=1 Tax=Candidatus Methylacidithermus pantelleriae TaxID=2744239 RepID=UPI00157C74E2|nr:hypothetical protein [Candidatus Methylacidithermus pantelleriae]
MEKKLYREGRLRGTSLVLYDLSAVCTLRGRAGGTIPLWTEPRSPTGSAASFSSRLRPMLKKFRFLVKNLRANRADSKTLVALLVTLQGRLGIPERTLVFDGGTEKPVELEGA